MGGSCPGECWLMVGWLVGDFSPVDTECLWSQGQPGKPGTNPREGPGLESFWGFTYSCLVAEAAGFLGGTAE